MPTLPEELMLAALDDEGRNRSTATGALSFGLAGAALLELAFTGRIRISAHSVEIADPTQRDDAVLNAVLHELGRTALTKSLHELVMHLQHHLPLQQQVQSQLVRQGAVFEEEGRFLWVFPSHLYPPKDPSLEAGLHERLQSAMEQGVADERTVALAAMATVSRLNPFALDKSGRAAAERRIAALAAGSPTQFVWDATERAYAEMVAAVVMAAR